MRAISALWDHVEEPVHSPLHIGIYAIRPDQTTLSRDQIFNKRRRCQKNLHVCYCCTWHHVEESTPWFAGKSGTSGRQRVTFVPFGLRFPWKSIWGSKPSGSLHIYVTYDIWVDFEIIGKVWFPIDWDIPTPILDKYFRTVLIIARPNSFKDFVTTNDF